MSSLSIQASTAAANLRPHPPTNTIANTPDTRQQPPNTNPPSTAGAAATVAPVAQRSVTRLEPTAPPAPPNADLANQAAQQVTAGNTAAADARAVQAGSSAIRSFLDITI
jgi:hypothetical protein